MTKTLEEMIEGLSVNDRMRLLWYLVTNKPTTVRSAMRSLGMVK